MERPDESRSTDRRSFLATAAAVGAAAALGSRALAARTRDAAAQAAPAAAAPVPAGKPFRLVHMTDIHVQPERRAEAGMAAALAHAQAQKPDLIVTGGDAVMDVFEAKRDRAETLRGCFQGTLKRECGTPVKHTTGNHDILGWNKKKGGYDGTEADWGKRFACDLYGEERTYHTFDQGGWRFICLDSVQPAGDGYVGYLDEAQWDWLQKLLAATPKSTPVAVVSHIPILSLTTLTYGKPRGREGVGKDNVISAGEMHTDATLVHDLFKKAGNVKLCLSGHIHLLDRCELDGVTYICDGAVSGNWWKGTLQGVPEGFGVLDLNPDGTFAHRYEPYGWKA